MFNKKAEGATLLGAGDRIDGSIVIRGRLHIDGMVHGDIEAEGEVSIGPEGRIEGELRAQNVSVAGTVDGTIVARSHLHMLSTGKVQGDAYFQSLQVDRGGVIYGRTASIEELDSSSPLALVQGGKDDADGKSSASNARRERTSSS